MSDTEIRAELRLCEIYIAGITTRLNERGSDDPGVWRGLEKCGARMAALALQLRDVAGNA